MLTAPLSGRPCYASQTRVWQHSGRSEGGPWQKVAEETLHEPFFVEDSTGQLLVEPLGAELDLPEVFGAEYGKDVSSQGPADVPARVSVFLARHGISLAFPTRLEECIVAPATPVFIAGTLKENPGIRVPPFSHQMEDLQASKSIRRAATGSAQSAGARQIIRLSNGPSPTSTTEMTPQGKIAAALARAGITNPETWADAGLAATEVPVGASAKSSLAEAALPGGLAESATLDGAPERASVPGLDAPATTASDDPGARTDTRSSWEPVPPLVVIKGEDNPTFVISCPGRQEPAGSPGWRSVGLVVCGAALTTLGLCVLLFQWHFR